MTLPKKLYKFESFNELSLKNLKKQAVFFGSPKKFNDPYDCAITAQVKDLTTEQIESFKQHLLKTGKTPPGVLQDLKTRNPQEVINIVKNLVTFSVSQIKDNFLSTSGVTCFSEDNDNLLMWAHYGGRYKGFCLEFDSQQPLFERAKKVIYQNEMPEIDPLKLLENDEQAFRQLFEDLFCIKSKSWDYEKEWRVFHKQADTLFTYPDEALTGVYFGPDIEIECLEIIALILKGQNENVKFFQGRRSDKTFKVEYKEFLYASYIEAKRLGLR